MHVEYTFLICRIDLLDLVRTHVDMYPYLVANIKISNVWLQFHQYLRNLMQGIIIVYPLLYPPYYVRTYVPYGFLSPVLFICVHSSTYDRIYRGIIHGRDSAHARTFSISILVRASVHACNISRNVRACASTIIRAHVYSSILARTSVCPCTGFREHLLKFPCDHLCSRCLSYVCVYCYIQHTPER